MMLVRRFPLCATVALLTLIGCSTSESGESSDDPPRQQTGSATPESEPLRTHEDPGPAMERSRGELTVLQASPVTLTADAVDRDEQGHVYVRADGRPESSEGAARSGVELGGTIRSLTLKGEPHGVAAVSRRMRVPTLYLQIASKSRPKDRTVRLLEYVDDRDEGPRLVWRTWTVDIPEEVKTENSLDDEARAALAGRFERRERTARSASSGSAEFYRFAEHRLREIREDENGRRGRDRRTGWTEDAMSDLTGRTAIDETLQADTTVESTEGSGDERVRLGDVERLAVPQPPWSELLDSFDGDRPSTEPVAELVPDDRIYARFQSLREFIRFLDGTGESLAPILGSLSDARQTGAIVDRYQDQLGLDPSEFAEKFGDLAVEEVALLLDDPYLPSGTAVTLVFRTNTPEAVHTFLDSQLREATADRKTSSKTIAMRGREVRHERTPDRRLSHYRLDIDGGVAVSNSPAPLEAITAVDDGDRPSLADDPGFTFMRHWYQVDSDRTGFLYIGEHFVERFTGPAYRVAQARRIRARAELWSLHYGSMLYGWMEGKWPAERSALFESRYVDDEPGQHSDGTPIEFGVEEGASSAHGQPEWMRPISEYDVDRLTPAEHEGYRDFTDRYERLGHQYIDPIAVSFDRSDEQTTFDVRVMPIHQRSEYRDLAELVGDVQLSRGPSTAGVEWQFGIGKDSELRRWTRRSANRMIRSRDVVFDWLGSWGAVGLADRSGLWDAALLAGLVPSRSGDMRRVTEVSEAQAKALDRIPFWLALEVKSPMGFATFMSGIRAFAEEAAPNVVSWKSAEPYRDLDITTIEIQGMREVPGIDVYYTVSNGVFLFSIDRKTLEHRVDALKAGYTPRPAPGLRDREERDASSSSENDPAESSERSGSPNSESRTDPDGPQSEVRIRRSGDESWLARTLHGLVESALAVRLPGVAAARIAASRGWPDRDGDALHRRAEQWWGVRLRNPHGHRVTVQDGAAHDPLYGFLPAELDRPTATQKLQKLPEFPVERSPIADWLEAVDAVQFQMSFERYGDALGLHARTEFEWRNSE